MVKRISFIIVFTTCLFLGRGLFAQTEALKGAEALILKGAYAQGARRCRNIISGYRDSKSQARAYYLLAICLWKQDEFAEARKKLEYLLRHYPDSKFCQPARQLLGNDYFSVQTGSFKKKSNAQGLRQQLIDKGYQAYILEPLRGGLFRVRVGRFSTRLQAESLERKLRAEGYPTKICP